MAKQYRITESLISRLRVLYSADKAKEIIEIANTTSKPSQYVAQAIWFKEVTIHRHDAYNIRKAQKAHEDALKAAEKMKEQAEIDLLKSRAATDASKCMHATKSPGEARQMGVAFERLFQDRSYADIMKKHSVNRDLAYQLVRRGSKLFAQCGSHLLKQWLVVHARKSLA